MATKTVSTETEKPIVDIKTALADINARSALRMKAIQESNASNKARVRTRRNLGDNGIQGLASLHNTLGRQYMNKPESQNS